MILRHQFPGALPLAISLRPFGASSRALEGEALCLCGKLPPTHAASIFNESPLLSRTTLAVAVVIAAAFSACVNRAETPAQAPAAGTTAPQQGGEDARLAARLKEICGRAGGRCGVAVTHVETGRGAAFEGDAPLPLYSVFKLPLAVEVLKQVEAGRLQLEQKVRVEP